MWENTLLVIIYDEAGGFWDHVPPVLIIIYNYIFINLIYFIIIILYYINIKYFG